MWTFESKILGSCFFFSCNGYRVENESFNGSIHPRKIQSREFYFEIRPPCNFSQLRYVFLNRPSRTNQPIQLISRSLTLSFLPQLITVNCSLAVHSLSMLRVSDLRAEGSVLFLDRRTKVTKGSSLSPNRTTSRFFFSFWKSEALNNSFKRLQKSRSSF